MAKTNRGFRFFTGDINWIDYGGTWMRKVAERRWHFIQLTNMDEACGSDNDGRPTYVVELSEVDLDAIPLSTAKSAWESCGGGPIDSTDGQQEISAGACFEYGARAPLHSEETNNAHFGIRECRKESYSLTSDAAAYRERMDRPVNRLGSTAREYMVGDLASAVSRGADAGDPAARIIAKMYVAADGQTLGGKVPEADMEIYRDIAK